MYRLALTLVAFSFLLSAVADAQSRQPAAAQPVKLSDAPAADAPSELEGVGIDEHLDMPLPLDLVFNNEEGKPVKLGEFFDGKRPAILTLVYFGCPMLCGLVSNAQFQAMKEIEGWLPGREYDVVTISFDPRETSELAKLKKENYLKEFGKPEAAAGIHFLTGKQDAIDTLTATVGFKYRWDEKQQQFAHAAAIVMVTPQGHLSRYLYGVTYDPKVLRLSLVEASQGKIGSTMDRVLLFCFHYDANRRGYALAAQNLMTAGGAITVLIVAAWLVPAWVKGRKHANTSPS